MTLIHIYDYCDSSPLISIVAESLAKKSQCPSTIFFFQIKIIAPKNSFLNPHTSIPCDHETATYPIFFQEIGIQRKTEVETSTTS